MRITGPHQNFCLFLQCPLNQNTTTSKLGSYQVQQPPPFIPDNRVVLLTFERVEVKKYQNCHYCTTLRCIPLSLLPAPEGLCFYPLDVDKMRRARLRQNL